MSVKYFISVVLPLLLLAAWDKAALSAEVERLDPPETVLPDVADSFSGYRARREGDAALVLGNFDQAERFYREYGSSALVRGDTRALQDSIVRLVNLYLQKGDISSAEREIAAYREKSLNEFIGRSLDAEVLMLKRDFAGAEKQLRELLATADLPDYLFAPLQFALGESLMLQKHYKAAAESYKLLNEAEPSFDASFRYIYALQSGGELESSGKALESLSQEETTSQQAGMVKLLFVNQYLMEKRFTEAASGYRNLPEMNAPDRLRYTVALKLADHFLANNLLPDGAEFLNEAFTYAPGLDERNYILTALMDLEARSGNYQRAADLMRRYLAYFPDDTDRYGNTLQLAHLLVRGGQLSGASVVYRELFDDGGAPHGLRLTAAREGSEVLKELKRNEEVEQLLKEMIAFGKSDDERAEGNYLLSRYYYEMQSYDKAIEIARLCLSGNTRWRFPGLYVLMEAQSGKRDYAGALESARTLKTQGIDSWPERGCFAEAELLEKSGDIDGAINAYDSFSVLWQLSELAPRALYTAGRLSFERGDYGRAGDLFQRLVQRYPQYEFTAHGMHLAVYSSYMQGNLNRMDDLINQMKRLYPDSAYTLRAQLWRIDVLKLNRDYAGALNHLNSMADFYAEKSEEAYGEVRYEQGGLLLSQGDRAGAVGLFEEVLNSGVSAGLKSKCSFVLGDISMSGGDYDSAAAFFSDALRLAQDREFSLAAEGRLADTLYSIGTLNEDVSRQAEALKHYRNILDSGIGASSGVLYWQTCYKLGSLLNLSGDVAGALKVLDGMLISASGYGGEFTDSESTWIKLGIELSVKLNLSSGSGAGIKSASGVIELAGGLKLSPAFDLEPLKQLVDRERKLLSLESQEK